MTQPAWRRSCRARFVPWLVTSTAVVILALMWVASTVPDNGEPTPGWVLWLLAVVGLVVVAAGLILGVVEVSVEQDGIVLRYGTFGWPVQRFGWPEISAVSAIDVHPTQWGGWGYRWVPWKRGTAAVMRAGAGLRIDRIDGRVFVVTVDDPQGAVHAASPLLIRN